MKILELTEDQKVSYAKNGYLIDLPAIFNAEEIKQLNLELKELEKLLEPGEKLLHMREWHMESKWLYDLCANPQILKYVEGILGPDFFMWGTQFFAKEPNSKDTVAWHQDAYYWPLSPHHSVTVWLAFTDVDDDNAAMRVIPGTHDKGLIKHRAIEGDSVLTLELEQGTYKADEAKSLIMKAGQISLHDDNIVHGSPANFSDRWRIGLTTRYSSTKVKCDMARSPKFVAYLMKGEDKFNYNPRGMIPTEKYGRLPKDFYETDTNVVRPK